MAHCERCGTEKKETGAPIWEIYCPNKDCTLDKERFYEGVREAIERAEREMYEQLKRKFEGE